MLNNSPAFYFNPNYNWGNQTPLVQQQSYPVESNPSNDFFLLLDGTDFLLLDGTHFLLLGT